MVLYLLESRVQKEWLGDTESGEGAVCRHKQGPNGETIVVWNWFEAFYGIDKASERFDQLVHEFGDAWSGTIIDITAAGSVLRDHIRVKDLVEQIMYGADVCAPPELNSGIISRHWRSQLSDEQDLREALAEASISIACALDEAPSTEDLEHIQSKITEVENLMAPIDREDLEGDG